ncbi:hypothetical protein KJ688_13630, partial [bacterium]|nr:hypothetical protein [bacterium]
RYKITLRKLLMETVCQRHPYGKNSSIFTKYRYNPRILLWESLMGNSGVISKIPIFRTVSTVFYLSKKH